MDYHEQLCKYTYLVMDYLIEEKGENYVCDICNETVRGPEHTYRCALVTTLGDKSLCCTVSDGLKQLMKI